VEEALTFGKLGYFRTFLFMYFIFTVVGLTERTIRTNEFTQAPDSLHFYLQVVLAGFIV